MKKLLIAFTGLFAVIAFADSWNGDGMLAPFGPDEMRADLKTVTAENPEIEKQGEVNQTKVAVKEEKKERQTFTFHFPLNESKIQPSDEQKIGQLGDLIQNRSAAVTLSGHADSTGPADYNRKLSQERAKSIAQALKRQFDIGDQKLRIQAFGESRPVASNETETGRAKNRRTVINVLAE